MKQFFYLGFLASWIAGVAVAIFLIVATAGLDNWTSSRSSWAAWILKQKQELIRQPSDRRLIVISGSNGLFGIDADQLEKETSYRAINAATHAGLPWKLNILTSANLARSGDIVLMPLEYASYYRDEPLNSLAVEVAHQIGLRYFLTLSMAQKLTYIRLLTPDFIQQQIQQWISPKVATERYQRISKLGYWKFGLSQRGDVDLTNAEPELERVISSEESRRRLQIYPDKVDEKGRELCRNIESLTERGVRVIGTPDNVYMLEMATRDARHATLIKAQALFKRCGGEWLDVPSEGLQPIDHMLDSVFHLNNKGRQSRTQELAVALCAQALACSPGK